MKLKRVVLAVGLVAGVAALASCDTASRAFGVAKVTPDEFRVVTKAPLVVPPDYSLRPPQPGEPRPQELQPESAARQALDQASAPARFAPTARSSWRPRPAPTSADPLIRYVVDDEFGNLAHKDQGFADWVMFWKRGQQSTPPGTSDPNNSQPLDPAVEEQRVKSLTGDHTIVIAREGSSKVKLPGL